MPLERFLQITEDGGIQPSRDFASLTAAFFDGPLNVVGSGSLAGRAAFNASAVGAVYVDTDEDPWEFYIHTAAGDNWTGPQTFVDPGVAVLRAEVVDDFLGGDEGLALDTAAALALTNGALGDLETTVTAVQADLTALEGATLSESDVAELISSIALTTKHIYIADATWTKPALLDYIIIRLCGGGGGAGGVKGDNTNGGAGAGGGGGAWSEHMVVAASLAATEAVTIGANGVGGDDTPGNGTAGGTSSFGAHCTAPGGAGGIGRTASANQAGTPGAAGGAAGTGNIMAAPGNPGTPPVSGGIGGSADRVSGNGGGTPWGGGAVGKTASSGAAAAGNNAVGRGCGGGGAVVRGATTAGAAGGAGQDGVVEVTEYFRLA